MNLTHRLALHGKALDELNEEPRPHTAEVAGSIQHHRDGVRILLQLMKDGWTDEALT
jgi:hypothetical protein